jgi:flagellar biosynthesis protein FlhB
MIVEVKHSKPLVTNPESISAAGRWDQQLSRRAVAE